MILVRSLLLCIATLMQAPDGDGLIQSVEQQRGGRHWIDQPTAPPQSPEDSLSCFEIEPGYRIELVAAEPLIFDPVGLDFDHRGRMFAAEYSDYPVGPKDPQAAPLSRIVMLEDTDGDRRMDRRTVFAEQLKFCHSLMAFREGVLACTETQIVYLPDSNNDGVSDRCEIWFEGFLPAHPQMQIGCPRRGLDNWIYFTYGHGKVRCLRPGFETIEAVDIPRVDFRFHPETMKFEAVAGAGQFGNSIDNYGHRFFSSNRNPIMTDLLSLNQISKNRFSGIAVGHVDVGPSGEKTRVYPKVAMKSNWLSHAGTHTSACGVTAYRGGAFGPESDRSVFVCEPVGHLVTRSILQQDGAGLTAGRARETADFLTSSDTWFRPASLSTGPDGALYLADMYRLWVEHPKFVPDDVAAKMDWRAGEDRGRVWRIVKEDVPNSGSVDSVSDYRPPVTDADLLALLRDPNGWRRMLAQRLLVDGQRTDLEMKLRTILVTDSERTGNGFSRLHALWTLHGLGRLTSQDLKAAADDSFAPVRRDVMKLAGESEVQDNEMTALQQKCCSDADGEVRMQALLSLGKHGPLSASGVNSVASSTDIWIHRAALLSVPEQASAILEATVTDILANPNADLVAFRTACLRQLAINVAVRGEIDSLKTLLNQTSRVADQGQWWKAAIVSGLAEGLPSCINNEIPKSLAAFQLAPPMSLRTETNGVVAVLSLAKTTALDRKGSEPDRVAAMGLITHLPPEQLQSCLEALLVSGELTGCQRAAIEVARKSGRVDAVELILSRWDQLAPMARSAALDLFLTRKESTTGLLQRMSEGAISPSVVSIDQRLILLQNPDSTIRSAAQALFGGTVSADRRAVAQQYAAALEIPGDRHRGALVFEKTCSKCHRVGGVGSNVGPDISDTRARARDALLYDILDPNRRVDPQYSEYVVVTNDGRLLNGLLLAETADSVTLRQPEGREQSLPRADIEELRATSKSLMPEGIERDVSVEQMADILAFLKSM
ncbi:MAG: PVC-type heme-binding CxxCH protein [Planctomycetia bacterium]